MQISSNPGEHNQQQFEQAVSLLQQTEAQLVLIRFDHQDARDELIDSTIGAVPELQPVLLDLSKTKVVSLKESMEAKLPVPMLEAKEITAVIHIANLEGTFLSEMLEGESLMLPQLQAEAASLKGAYPLHLFLWLDAYGWDQVQQHAPAITEAATATLSFFHEEADKSEVYQNMRKYVDTLASTEDPTELGQTHIRIANILLETQRQQEASVHFEKALEYAAISSDAWTSAHANLGIGKLMILEQDLAQAMEQFELARPTLLELDETGPAAEAATQIARIHIEARDFTKAIAIQKKALAGFQETSQWKEAGLNGKRLAWCYERKGDLDQSVSYYHKAAEDYARINNHYEQARCYQQAAAILQNQRKYASSLDSFTTALTHAQQTEDDFLIHALEDSIEDLTPLAEKKGDSAELGKKKKGGLFGRLFG